MNSTSMMPSAFASLLVAAAVHARPVREPPISELWQRAEIVVVVRPQKTARNRDQLTHAGPKYGRCDPGNYQGFNTECTVEAVLKGSDTISMGVRDSIVILHFAYTSGPLEFNGGLFMYFHTAPTKLVTIPVRNSGPLKKGFAENGRDGEAPLYLAFLTTRGDGRFEPVTGNYDASPSFRILTSPFAGGMAYALFGLPGKEDEDMSDRSVEATPGGAPD